MLNRLLLALLIAAAPLSALAQSKGNPTFGTVHADQFIGPLLGNAATATTAATVGALATPRTLTLSGDAGCSFVFDGSANAGCSLTLAASGVTAGTFGDATHTPIVTVDSKGRVTGISVVTISGGGGGAVTSVAGRTGAVTLTSSDLTDGTSLGRSVFTAASAAAARSSLGAAESGANSSITSLTGLTTALPIAEGGTGATTASAARSALGAAGSGANTDITSLSSGVTVTTAAANDNSTKLSTTAYADRAATNAVAAVQTAPPVRQTAISGPAASGAPSFLPATTSGTLTLTAQNVSASAPLIVTAAQGGLANAITTLTSNPSWTLTGSATNYLFVNASTGATVAYTLAPIYQFGGTPSTTNNQFTFDYSPAGMTGYLGNGTTAVPTPLVAVGEAVTSSTAVTSSIAYAYQGRYDSGFTAGLPGNGVAVSASHNLGLIPATRLFVLQCTTADAGYSVGDQIDNTTGVFASGATVPYPISVVGRRNTISAIGGNNTPAFGTSNPNTGAFNSLTVGSWQRKFVALRGW